MLCHYCQRLDWVSLFSYEGAKHHSYYGSLVQCAAHCELCATFQRLIERDLVQSRYINQRKPVINAELGTAPRLCVSLPPGGSSIMEIFAAENELGSEMIHLRPVAKDCESNGCFAQALDWLERCRNHHSVFCGRTENIELPTRVIDVLPRDSSGDIRLCTTNGKSASWVTLSHCWGDNVPFTTTASTLTQRLLSIAMADLPQSFRDAVKITRLLGERYLWIDAICIIQDYKEDWLAESARMGYIYKNSTLTIAASAARDSTVGIFKGGNQGRLAKPFDFEFSCRFYTASMTIHAREFTSIIEENEADEELDNRGWAMQEDLLSPRALRYGRSSMTWSCNAAFYCEADPDRNQRADDGSYHPRRLCLALPDSSWKPMKPIGDTEIFYCWYNAINYFVRRKLTFGDDKSPSLAGVASQFASQFRHRIGATYKAGLWQEDIHRGLLWQASPLARPSTKYLAPSWSWGSLNGSTSSEYTRSIYRAFGHRYDGVLLASNAAKLPQYLRL